MSSWPSKRKKSGRREVSLIDDIGTGDKGRGCNKKITSGKRRVKYKRELRKETEQLYNEKTQ